MKAKKEEILLERMIAHFGATLSGADLYHQLGFNTYAAFYRSRARGELGVRVFSLPGRRGWFALTTDVANWLISQRDAENNIGEKAVRGL